MILETREQLQRQLTDSWNILVEVDAALEDAVDALNKARKDIKRITREHHDQTGVRGAVRMGTTEQMGTRTEAQALNVRGVPTSDIL